MERVEDVAEVAVVVLAGGGSTRWAAQTAREGRGGPDKLAAPLGGVTVLEHLLRGLTGREVVLVGPGGIREDPPGGGPLAGFAAGLGASTAGVLVLLGGDQPFAASAVPRLLAALEEDPALDAVVGVDADGRRQPLLSAHRRERARRVLDGLPAVAGLPLRELFRGRVGEVAVSAREALDVDVPQDLARARALLPGPPAARGGDPEASGPGPT
ncbi:molybdopterin-guanine dinucleotide biosynthesis protein A [Kineococcus radiotolerans]|uniref:Molybdopterin-guanine dinucleotide biosynthesis protein A n=1 Tax=Kineococcus radiotolerans TaxID=131568 RepID=A0A7W4TLD4_KINRA|nr:NTP transferase domain-containing protein [Kineococcus radiotolerans]MBB2901058.1 molybdopterin-guanine dinucleotide biosynthesis protein A [Kineococcus radiotolerans]